MKEEWRTGEDFELPTPRFVVWCSIQLSYRCLSAIEVASQRGKRRREMRPAEARHY